MTAHTPISSQITFLYFDDQNSAAPFFEDVLKLEIVEEQEAAKIYRIAGGAFIGIVDGKGKMFYAGTCAIEGTSIFGRRSAEVF